jgi:hypothetical protein
MQKIKHTNGEWFIQGKNLIKCGNEQIASANSMLDEYEANAKLISAAPDLLNVVLKLDSLINELGLNLPSEFLQQYENAIQKTK